MQKILIIFAVVLFISCNTEAKKQEEEISKTAMLISNVNIINVKSGEIEERRNVVVDSGKIVRILDSINTPLKYPKIINGEAKFLIPGLAEMHAHIPQPPTSAERIEETLYLYLANGVTTIRGMLGHPLHIELRKKAKNGAILSPRIFTASPSLNGNSVTTKEEAIEKVTTYKEMGYDFLKIHPGIQKDVFDQVVKTANKVGIPYAGHVPVAVGIRHALESKYASIDHIDGFLEGLVPESANVKPEDNGFFGFNFSKLADTTKIDELVQLAKKNKVWIVPTQSLFERWFSPKNADELLSQPEMKYMPKETLDNWKATKIRYDKEQNFSVDKWNYFDVVRRKLIKKLQADGHGMLLGSDAPQLFNVPGFSIMHEIDGMVNGGMTPIEILRAGTINPATYFGMNDTFGEIKEGMDADFVLLEKNPLKNLKNMKLIEGVMVQGKWLSISDIQTKLKEIEANATKE